MRRIEVIIEVTYNCNLRCKYCYNSETGYKKEVLSLERFRHLLELLSQKYHEIKIVWHGGEPLCCGIEYFKQAMELELEFTNLKSIKISNSIQTNGTLINEEWIKVFKKYGISNVGISFDGIEHNKYRQCAEETLKAMELLKKHNIKHGCMSVVSSDSYDLIANYNFFKERGLNMEFSYLSNEGEAADMPSLTAADFTKKAIELFDLWLYDLNGINIRLFTTYISMALGSGFRICTNSSCHGKYISIAPNGDLSNCGRIMMERYKFGNIDDMKTIDDIYNSKVFLEMLKGAIARRNYCKDHCDYYNYCSGGCSEQAILAGDITKPSKDNCYNFIHIFKHIKQTIEKCIEENVPLTKLNPFVRNAIIKSFNTGQSGEPLEEKFV